MTRQEWLDEKDIYKLIEQITSNRKRQLFSIACAKSIQHLILDQRSKDCLEKIELFIDDKIDEEEFEIARQAAWDAADNIGDFDGVSAYWAICWAAVKSHTNTDWAARNVINYASNAAYWTSKTDERLKQLVFLRDICNPFLLNLKFSEQAVSLAEQVYNGDNDARGILSDYLEENKFPEEIYLHLKQPTHYKGCWVIDQILEKL